MDLPELQKAIVAKAKLDMFDGTGRIILSDFTKKYGVTRDEVLQALKNISFHFRIHGDNIVLVYFTPLCEKLRERKKNFLEGATKDDARFF